MKTRVLHVSNQFWKARARWVFRDGKWEAVIMDKELNFLKGLSAEQARDHLQKLGCQWQWDDVKEMEVHDGFACVMEEYPEPIN